MSEKFERASAPAVGGVTQVTTLENEAANDKFYDKQEGALQEAGSDRRILTEQTDQNDSDYSANGRTSSYAWVQAAQKRLRELKEKNDKLTRALMSLNKWLDKIEQMIEDMVEQIAGLRTQAVSHFDNAHEAEELRDGIKDGISSEEKEKLKKLLGNNIEAKNREEIIDLLNEYVSEQFNTGHLKNNAADALQGTVDKLKEHLKDISNEVMTLDENSTIRQVIEVQKKSMEFVQEMKSDLGVHEAYLKDNTLDLAENKADVEAIDASIENQDKIDAKRTSVPDPSAW